MLALVTDHDAFRPMRLLCVGAHCDDIEIGCGATLLALQGRGRPIIIDFVVLSGSQERRNETEHAIVQLVRPESRGELLFGDLPDGRFPAAYGALKDFFERLKALPNPDVILCHERDDRHQDHRMVNEMVWSTFRDHLVLEYEVPKWDGGLGHPNVYIPIEAAQAQAKVEALMAAYATQRSKDWFTPETFLGLLRLRGLECRSPSGYAEAFHGRKIRFNGI